MLTVIGAEMRKKQMLPKDMASLCQPTVVLERFPMQESLILQQPPLPFSVVSETNVKATDQLRKLVNIPQKGKHLNHTKPLTQESFLKYMNLQACASSHSVTKGEVISSPITIASVKPVRRRTVTESNLDNPQAVLTILLPKSCTMLHSLTLKNNNVQSEPQLIDVPADDSSDDEDDDAFVEKLLGVDLTSPLGRKLASLLDKQSLDSVMTVKNYNTYCNRTLAETKAETADNRCLRSQTGYCDDSWNLNNIHYVRLEGHDNLDRPYVFGQRARQKRYRTLKCGLNKRSRKLVPIVTPCCVVVDRMSRQLVETIRKAEEQRELLSCKSRLSPTTLSNTCLAMQTCSPPVIVISDISPSENTHMAIRKALAPILEDNPTSLRCETPLAKKASNRLRTMQKCGKRQRKNNSEPLTWKDLVYEDIKVYKTEVVDLTCDSDDETVICLPSPTSILSGTDELSGSAASEQAPSRSSRSIQLLDSWPSSPRSSKNLPSPSKRPRYSSRSLNMIPGANTDRATACVQY